MPTLADQIRAMLAKPRRHVHGSETVALLAVVDKCEQIRYEPSVLSAARANEFLSVIARELGITPEESR